MGPKKELKKEVPVAVTDNAKIEPIEEKKTGSQVLELSEIMIKQKLSSIELSDLQRKRNSELNEKTLVSQSIDDLREQYKKAEAVFKSICDELNLKKREIDHINSEVGAQNTILKNIKSTIEREKSEELESLKSQQDEITKANDEYKSLIEDAKQKKEFLDSELYKISDERNKYTAESIRLNTAMKKNEETLASGLLDIEEQREALTKEKEEFEALKLELEPEFKRISEIKNNSDNYAKLLEEQKSTFDAERVSFSNEKDNLMAQIEVEKKRVMKYEAEVQVRENEIEKKRQELADIELELKARDVEASKMMKRYQLTQTVESSKK